ncbi:MAG TPA: site-2 protease family protein [Chloroflexia bacterium]|nr:site-2 protease family protein [Chloroflexia bacterium]
MNIIPNFNAETFLGFMLGFVLGTTIHEFMHAYSALRLGDDTAERQGRVTLNPVAHFDPLGFFMGVLLALGVGFIAWGRPVPVNSSRLRFGRRGMSIVAVAGPISNLVLAAVLTLILKVGGDALPDTVYNVIGNMIGINLLLFCFNLIPIPPLDGFNILVGILPNYWVMVLEPIRRYSIPILLGLVFVVPLLGQQLGIQLDPVSRALRPIYDLLQNIILGFLAR